MTLEEELTWIVGFSTNEDIVERLAGFVRDKMSDEYQRGYDVGFGDGLDAGVLSCEPPYSSD